MTGRDVVAVLSIVISFGTPLAIFLARNWLKARIEAGVRHHFDVQIENVRAELRKSEERFKSDLRDKEGEIATLRSSVLAGSANRQGLLDKRRFEAVEKVWHDVNDLARLKELSSRIAMLNIKAVAKEASDPKMQSFLSTIGAGTPDLADFKNAARDEQPFLPELAWAYFTAYKTILHANFALYRVLKIGLDDVDKYLSKEQVSKILKAVLPHRSQFIDDREMGAYHYLLDEIESSLLGELRNILEGKVADQAAAARAKEIMNAVKAVKEKNPDRDAVAAIESGE